MFTLDYKNDRYELRMPDDSILYLPKGVEDTKPLRRECAKLSHRIAMREHITTHQDYIPDWPLEELTHDQLLKLKDLYNDINQDSEIWTLLESYEHPSHIELAMLEHNLVKEKKLLMRLLKVYDEKKSS